MPPTNMRTGNDDDDDVINRKCERKQQEVERRKYEMDQGWSYVVACASFLTSCLMGAMYCGYAVLIPAWISEFQTTSGMASLVGSTASGFASGLAPVSSCLLNRFDHRTTHMIGGVIATIGIFLCSFATSLPQVFVFYGFFGGFGMAICYIPSVMIVRDYFQRRYAIVIAIVSSGVGFGLCVFPIIIESLESRYGWRGAMLVFSAIMANMCVSAAILFPNPPVVTVTSSSASSGVVVTEVNGNFLSSEQLHAMKSKDDVEEMRGEYEKAKKKTFRELSMKTFRNPYFHLGIITNLTHFFCMMLVVGITPMRSQFEFDMSPEQGALLASAFGFSTTLARLLWGAVSMANKRIDPYKLSLLLRVLTSLVILGSIFGKSFNIQLMCSILLGIGFGCWSLYGIYIPLIFDSDIVCTVFGYLELCNGIGCLIGPFVGGLIYDVTGSFWLALVLAGCVLLTASILLYFGNNCLDQRKHRKRVVIISAL